MSEGIIGKKIGMTRLFGKDGEVIHVTVLQAGPCPVVQVKRPATDGYSAVQLGYDPLPERLVNKPTAGHFKRAGVGATRVLREFRLDDASGYEVGKTVGVDLFSEGELVRVVGTSKGKGTQGPQKRWHSKGGCESHGSMYSGKRPGSMGSSSFPSRVFKGKGLAGHMGDARVTTLNLKVVRVDPERNLLIVRGSVPGPNEGYVTISRGGRGKKAVPAAGK